jgi:competence protein ComEC
VPGGTLYLPGLPYWWVVGFYMILIGVILYRVPSLKIVGILSVWILIAMIVPNHDRPEGELRIAILSVGHGSCTVIETPDGRCILYDTGSSFGTDATRRVIAPYLWHRGIRRIDEIFISHADADHFNGLPELLRRFSVGRITLTPSFAEKPTSEVAQTLLAIHKYAIPTRIATEGLKSQAGDVSVEVLHPPASGPDGSENVRSMVLLIEHAGHRILLTGDLEEAGMSRVLRRPATHVDILQAPHHGSQKAFPKSLVQWCTPRFVVVSRGTIYTNNITVVHVGNTIPVWDTPTHGTITIRSHASGLSVHSYRDGKIEAVRK